MGSARFAACAAVVLIALTSGRAHAADYSPPPVIYQPPPVEEFSGWYLRGDIGLTNQQVGTFEVINVTAPVRHVNKGFDSSALFGVGIGYYFNDWLRFDVTAEYRSRANFHGFDIVTLGGGGFLDDRFTASKSEWTFMFNAYVDLGTWYNFTPFVGAGIGVSRNTIHDLGDIAACVNSNNCTLGGSDAFAANNSKWSFAWALHAGVAYKVTKNFTVELAYRYINLGSAESGPLVAFDGTTGCRCHVPQFRDLTSHDIKLGVRFNLDGLFDGPRYAPQPVYSQPAPVYTQPAPVYAPPPAPVYAPAPTYTPAPVYRSRG